MSQVEKKNNRKVKRKKNQWGISKESEQVQIRKIKTKKVSGLTLTEGASPSTGPPNDCYHLSETVLQHLLFPSSLTATLAAACLLKIQHSSLRRCRRLKSIRLLVRLQFIGDFALNFPKAIFIYSKMRNADEK